MSDIAKIIKKLGPGVAEEMETLDEEGLRETIVKAETVMKETDTEMAADEKLQGAKELLKDLRGAYNDVKKAQRAKVAYALHLLEQSGKI